MLRRTKRDTQVPDDSGLSDYCWIDLTADGDNLLELAKNLGGLEEDNIVGEARLHLKVRDMNNNKKQEAFNPLYTLFVASVVLS